MNETADSSSSSDDTLSEDKAKSRIEGLSAKGNQAFARKDYRAAIAAYSVAINLDKRNEKVLSNRSAAYAGAGQYEKALVILAHDLSTQRWRPPPFDENNMCTLAPRIMS